ncbi:MAG: magnesium chelatase, partial [Bacteroidetes bacterium]|nr:magnesium chelatase [Bacteroidota bacterium]
MDAEIITLETKIMPGIGYFIVGLPDEAIKESLHRVESAINSAGLNMPRQKILISMAPAGLPKAGAMFDLAIAVSILAASGQLNYKNLERYLFTGELSLYGKLRPVKGVLSMAMKAQQYGLRSIIVPSDNSAEAALVEGIAVYGIEDLSEVCQFLNGAAKYKPFTINSKHNFPKSVEPYSLDF